MTQQFAFFGLGTPELIIITLIILLLFGASKLPQLARSIGRTGHEIKQGLSEATDTKDKAVQQVKDLERAVLANDKA